MGLQIKSECIQQTSWQFIQYLFKSRPKWGTDGPTDQPMDGQTGISIPRAMLLPKLRFTDGIGVILAWVFNWKPADDVVWQKEFNKISYRFQLIVKYLSFYDVNLPYKARLLYVIHLCCPFLSFHTNSNIKYSRTRNSVWSNAVTLS